MTHAYLGLLCFNVTALVTGYAVLHAVGLVRSSKLAVRSAGLALFTGFVVLGVGLTTALSLSIGLDLLTVFVFVVLVLALSFVVRRRFPRIERAPVANRGSDPLTRALALGGAGILTLALLTAFLEGLRANADASYDIWANWLLKAKAIYYFHHLSTGLSGTATYEHINYPQLMPTMSATIFHFTGAAHTELLPLEQSIIVIAFFTSVVTLLGPHVPPFVTYPSLAMLAVAPAYWQRVIYVLPDLSLGYFVALAAITGILWLEERRHAWLVLTTLFLGGATLIKNEGFSFGLLLVVALVGAALATHGRFGLRGLVLVLGLAIIEPWHLWLSDRGLRVTAVNYHWSDLFRPHYLEHRSWRLRESFDGLEQWLFDGSRWLFVPFLVLAALVLLAFSRRAIAIAMFGWLVIAFFGVVTVFWIGRPNFDWYFSTGAFRIATTVPIVGCAVSPLLLGLAIQPRRADSS
jgi:hypothetical protein